MDVFSMLKDSALVRLNPVLPISMKLA
jgi:hypothetical protein